MKKINFLLLAIIVLFIASCSEDESDSVKIKSKFLGAYKTNRSISYVNATGKITNALYIGKVKIDPWEAEDTVSVWIGLNSTFRAKVGDSILIDVKDRYIYKPYMGGLLAPTELIKANIVGFGVMDSDSILNLKYQISYFVNATAQETYSVEERCAKVP